MSRRPAPHQLPYRPKPHHSMLVPQTEQWSAWPARPLATRACRVAQRDVGMPSAIVFAPRSPRPGWTVVLHRHVGLDEQRVDRGSHPRNRPRFLASCLKPADGTEKRPIAGGPRQPVPWQQNNVLNRDRPARGGLNEYRCNASRRKYGPRPDSPCPLDHSSTDFDRYIQARSIASNTASSR